jgi:subtilisin family serine protease
VKVRIAVIDSGVHASHPHVNGVAGGVSITPDGREESDYVDRLGHGTAVTAAIREKAPDAEIYAVKVFHDSLATRIVSLVNALDWSARNGINLINLSLGTDNPRHEAVLRAAVDRLLGQGIKLIAAYEDAGVRWLPGSIVGVVPVVLDWDCPRDAYRTSLLPDGRTLYHASGFPRPIPGVAPNRNLKGISFAVANVTGLIAKSTESVTEPRP